MDAADLMTMREVARALAISRSAAYRLAASGKLPIVRIGSSVRVLRKDLAAFIRARRSPTVSTETVEQQ